MSKDHYSIQRHSITDITDAIRDKYANHDTMTLAEIPGKIRDIPQTVTGYPLKRYIQRGDAERVERWVRDELWVADLGKTLPTYSTTAKVLVTGANLTPMHTLAYADYDYYVFMRGLSYPIYSNAPAKGRCDYCACGYNYAVISMPANTTYTIDGTKSYASRNTVITAMGSTGRTVYWSSATAIAAPQSNVTYGFYINGQAPTLSSGVLTVKAPNYGCRGHTTYNTSGNWSKITDLRWQWVVELWQIPKGNGTDGLMLNNFIEDCFTDVRENGGTLVPV